jgi:hypothetical protein
MKSLKEMIKKKMEAGDMMPEKSKKAMENVLKELDDLADEGMAGKLQKVTVASDSEEGLKKGLEMAEDKVEEMSEDSDSSLSEDLDSMAEGAKKDERDDYMAQSSDSDDDYDSMSEEDLERKIKELEELKSKMA